MMALQTITGKQQFWEEPTARNSKRLPQKGKGAVRLRSWHRGGWMRLQTIKDRMNVQGGVDEVLLFTNFSWHLRYQLWVLGSDLWYDSEGGPQSVGLGWRFNRPKHQEPWTFVATSRHISLNSSTDWSGKYRMISRVATGLASSMLSQWPWRSIWVAPHCFWQCLTFSKFEKERL